MLCGDHPELHKLEMRKHLSGTIRSEDGRDDESSHHCARLGFAKFSRPVELQRLHVNREGITAAHREGEGNPIIRIIVFMNEAGAFPRELVRVKRTEFPIETLIVIVIIIHFHIIPKFTLSIDEQVQSSPFPFSSEAVNRPAEGERKSKPIEGDVRK
jgi:hypothetical protein